MVLSDNQNSSNRKKGGRSARRRAREYALQGLYQWLITKTDPVAIDAAALETEDFAKVDAPFYRELLHGIVDNFEQLEQLYAPLADRDVQAMSPIERSILLIGAYELKNTPTPYRVILNEAIELAKSFGGMDGYRYVNGVLDKLAPQLRPHEINK